jgi:hypothetical protein
MHLRVVELQKKNQREIEEFQTINKWMINTRYLDTCHI